MTRNEEDMAALDLECRLTIGLRMSQGDMDCARYFMHRRDVLFPAVLREAEKRQEDPIDVFADYARKVHARHGAA